jgi:hypothetical protein
VREAVVREGELEVAVRFAFGLCSWGVRVAHYLLDYNGTKHQLTTNIQFNTHGLIETVLHFALNIQSS